MSNEEVLYQAYRPTLPSALLEYQQYTYAVISYQSDRPDPTHNVIFGPAYKDLIRVKGRRRGMQFPYWLEVTSNRHFPDLKPDHAAGILGPHQFYAKIAGFVQSPTFELAPKRTKLPRTAIAKITP